ncbi:MAG: hypothetical protein J5746_12110 [Victivallales bacterium]|nr:hypothetical protein [Victivallales bacterium]
MKEARNFYFTCGALLIVIVMSGIYGIVKADECRRLALENALLKVQLATRPE